MLHKMDSYYINLDEIAAIETYETVEDYYPYVLKITLKNNPEPIRRFYRNAMDCGDAIKSIIDRINGKCGEKLDK